MAIRSRARTLQARRRSKIKNIKMIICLNRRMETILSNCLLSSTLEVWLHPAILIEVPKRAPRMEISRLRKCLDLRISKQGDTSHQLTYQSFP